MSKSAQVVKRSVMDSWEKSLLVGLPTDWIVMKRPGLGQGEPERVVSIEKRFESGVMYLTDTLIFEAKDEMLEPMPKGSEHIEARVLSELVHPLASATVSILFSTDEGTVLLGMIPVGGTLSSFTHKVKMKIWSATKSLGDETLPRRTLSEVQESMSVSQMNFFLKEAKERKKTIKALIREQGKTVELGSKMALNRLEILHAKARVKSIAKNL